MKKILLSLILLLFSCSYLQSQSLKLGWYQQAKYGIRDITALPNTEQFLVLLDGEVEIRDMKTGDTVKVYPIPAEARYHMKLVNNNLYTIGNKFQKFSFPEMQLISEYQLKKDSVNPAVYTDYFYGNFTVHPTLPFAYAIRSRHSFLSGGKESRSYFIDIFNTDEMKPVGQLTLDTDTLINWYKLDISKDGKYIAAIQQFDQGLIVKVWSTESNKIVSALTSNLQKPYYQSGIDLHFSEKSNLLYLSGDFSIDKTQSGIMIYDLLQNTIIDSTLTFPRLRIGSGEFLFNEKNNNCYMASTALGELYYLSLNEKSLLHKVDATKDENLKFRAFHNLIFNSNKTAVIGNGSGNSLTQILIDTNVTSVQNETQITNINTINNIATINYIGTNQKINYQILNLNGQSLISKEEPNINNQIKINFNLFPNGIYFVNLSCGNISSAYKIVKG